MIGKRNPFFVMNSINASSSLIEINFLKQAVVSGMNQAFCNQNEIKSILASTLEKVLTQDSDDEISGINLALERLQVQLLDASRKNDDIADIGEQIIRLKEEKEKLLLSQGANDNLKQRVQEMLEYLDNQNTGLETYDEVLVRRMVEEVKIFDNNIMVKFKSGIEIEVRG